MKHLNFLEKLSKTGKTKVITILSMHDNTNLGKIIWSGTWRQYVFSPNIEIETIWSHDCLEDLRNFIIVLNKEQKEMKLKKVTYKGMNKLSNGHKQWCFEGVIE